jgi:hypothetical protein
MGNREPGRDMSSALRGLPECTSPALDRASDRTHDRCLNPTNCDPRITQSPLSFSSTGLTSDADSTPHLAVPAKQAAALRTGLPPRSGLGVVPESVVHPGLRRWGREGGQHEITTAYCRIRSRRRAAMSRRATRSRLDLSSAPSLQSRRGAHPRRHGACPSREGSLIRVMLARACRAGNSSRYFSSSTTTIKENR